MRPEEAAAKDLYDEILDHYRGVFFTGVKFFNSEYAIVVYTEHPDVVRDNLPQTWKGYRLLVKNLKTMVPEHSIKLKK